MMTLVRSNLNRGALGIQIEGICHSGLTLTVMPSQPIKQPPFVLRTIIGVKICSRGGR